MKVGVAEEMDAGIEAVWALIGDFGGLARWNKTLQKVEAEGHGLGAVRRVTPPQGGLIVERVTAYDDQAHSFVYEVVSTDPPMPLDGFVVSIRLQPLAGERTLIFWDADVPDREGLPPAEAIAAMFRQRIDALGVAARGVQSAG